METDADIKPEDPISNVTYDEKTNTAQLRLNLSECETVDVLCKKFIDAATAINIMFQRYHAGNGRDIFSIRPPDLEDVPADTKPDTRQYHLDPSDGILITAPNPTDFEGDSAFFKSDTGTGDDDGEFLEWRLPKFRSLREVLEYADAIRDELIDKFNETVRSEHLGEDPTLRSKASKDLECQDMSPELIELLNLYHHLHS